MRRVVISRPSLQAIEGQARRSYPDEACGFLFSPRGESDSATRLLTRAETAENAFPGEQRRRFVITAEGLRAAEGRAESRGEVVSGFFHSHPDHPAVPSAFDTEHAWPWYAYVVVSVDRAGVCSAGAFELESDSGRFLRRELEVVGAPTAEPPVPGGPRSGPAGREEVRCPEPR